MKSLLSIIILSTLLQTLQSVKINGKEFNFAVNKPLIANSLIKNSFKPNPFLNSNPQLMAQKMMFNNLYGNVLMRHSLLQDSGLTPPLDHIHQFSENNSQQNIDFAKEKIIPISESISTQNEDILEKQRSKLTLEKMRKSVKTEDIRMLQSMIFYNLILNLERHCLLNFEVADCVKFKGHSKQVIDRFAEQAKSQDLIGQNIQSELQDPVNSVKVFVAILFEPYENEQNDEQVAQLNQIVLLFRNFYEQSFAEHFQRLEADYEANFADLQHYLEN